MKIKTWSFFKLLIYASTCGFKTEFVYWLFYLVSVPRNAGNYFDTHLYIRKVKVLVTQSCPTLCDPMDCSLPGSSVHGFLQARILEWVAIPFSRGSSQPRDETWVLHCRHILYHLYYEPSFQPYSPEVCHKTLLLSPELLFLFSIVLQFPVDCQSTWSLRSLSKVKTECMPPYAVLRQNLFIELFCLASVLCNAGNYLTHICK